MRCSKCGCQEDKVIDSRTSREGATIRRRRECLACGHRFTTYEVIENEAITVMKRDDRREPFSRDKLVHSLTIACRKIQALTAPFHIVTVPKLTGEVQFKIENESDANK